MAILLDKVIYKYPKRVIPALNVPHEEIGAGIHLLLGENGAGKTTLLHLMAGLLFPSEGCCLVDGTDTRLRLPSVTGRTAYMSADMRLPGRNVAEMVRIHSGFFPNFSLDMLARNLEDFAIDEEKKFKDMSLGTRQKAVIAYFLSLGTDYLLLDEPANGLDIESKETLARMMVRNIRADQTVVVSTHTISDLQNIYDGVVIMRQGRIQLAMNMDELSRMIAFTETPVPPADALYSEPRAGRYRGIVRAGTHEDSECDIDFHLLYNALHNERFSSRFSELKN